jgi:hypothetical protein
MEGGREDVPLADGDDTTVLEAPEDIDARPGPLDDGRPDEDAMDGLPAQNRYLELALE